MRIRKVLGLSILILLSIFLVSCNKEEILDGYSKITFDTGSSDKIDSIIEEIGVKVTAPKEVPEKDGFIFKGWSLDDKPYIFNKMPDKNITLTASYQKIDGNYNKVHTLPKMFINIENNLEFKEVVREEYVNTSITLTNVRKEHELTAVSSELKGRGNGSWTGAGPKRGYRLKFFNKESLFGEAANKHWVLLASANFYDTSMFKTRTVFEVSKKLFTNIQYTSSTNWVELYVNGEYRGVYVLAEHQRVDKNRINIESKYNELDTGYFLEYDAYSENEGPENVFWFKLNGYKYGVTVKSPDADDYLDEGLTEEEFRNQIAFIKNYTNQVLSSALKAPNSNLEYLKFIELADIDSFVDMYILHELFKNADTGWSSFYMHKEKGGKLFANAPWDFDGSIGTNRGTAYDQSPEGIYVGGSAGTNSSISASELYISLMKVDDFKNRVGIRWNELSGDIEALVNEIMAESYILETKEALGKNFFFWSENRNIETDPAEGRNAYAIYNSLEDATNGYVRSSNEVKKWILDRINWLNGYFK